LSWSYFVVCFLYSISWRFAFGALCCCFWDIFGYILRYSYLALWFCASLFHLFRLALSFLLCHSIPPCCFICAMPYNSALLYHFCRHALSQLAPLFLGNSVATFGRLFQTISHSCVFLFLALVFAAYFLFYSMFLSLLFYLACAILAYSVFAVLALSSLGPCSMFYICCCCCLALYVFSVLCLCLPLFPACGTLCFCYALFWRHTLCFISAISATIFLLFGIVVLYVFNFGIAAQSLFPISSPMFFRLLCFLLFFGSALSTTSSPIF